MSRQLMHESTEMVPITIDTATIQAAVLKSSPAASIFWAISTRLIKKSQECKETKLIRYKCLPRENYVPTSQIWLLFSKCRKIKSKKIPAVPVRLDIEEK